MSAASQTTDGFIIWSGRVLVRAANRIPVQLAGVRADAAIVPVIEAGGRVATYLLEAPDERAAQAAGSALVDGAEFVDVMMELGRYEPESRARLLRAIALERWSNWYRFCSVCASELHWATGEIAKICSNPQRVHRHFPRLDPAIIMLVSDGERILLGRAARWPAGMYSTLAGFVEPGETLEAAVRREVAEEAGIDCGDVRYAGSEAWPFPRSLMLGFVAQAQSVEVQLRDGELEDARWFTVLEAAALQQRMRLARPYFETIARRLIEAWLVQRGAGG